MSNKTKLLPRRQWDMQTVEDVDAFKVGSDKVDVLKWIISAVCGAILVGAYYFRP